MISVSIIQQYCKNRLECYYEQHFSLLSQNDMYMETKRIYLHSLKMYRRNNQLHKRLIPQEGELEKCLVAVAPLQRCLEERKPTMVVKWPLNSRKRFVYSSHIPENLCLLFKGITLEDLRKLFIFELSAVWNFVVKYTKCVARKGNILMCAEPANEQHQTPLLHQNNFVFKFFFQLYNSLFMGSVCFLQYIL